MIKPKFFRMKKITLAFALLFQFSFFSCSTQPKENSSSLDQQVKIENAWNHLEAFQSIASKNNNNRAVGRPGGLASTEYIVKTLKSYGLNPIVQDFTNSKGAKGKNVIVEIKGKSDKVSMLGAHYDSVETGPGINDNATGVAIVLEIISTLTQHKVSPAHTLRFVFWDSEETGVEGSRFYVKELSSAEKSRLANYINVDMVGTKDPNILILDSDGSSWKRQEEIMLSTAETEEEKQERLALIEGLKNGFPKQVKGSEYLEKLYSNYLNSKNVAFEDDYILSNSTDVFPFIGMIPTIGIIMTNITEHKGDSLYAPCYHLACDDINNVDKNSFRIALESISYLLYEVAIKSK